MKDYDTYFTAPEIKKRLQRYDTHGGWCATAFGIALMAMALTAIFRAPELYWQVACGVAVVSGMLTAGYILQYAGAQQLLKDAENPTPTEGG